ncbi:MAG: hypothetical protein ACLPIC_18235 [Rhodoblastus sp.]|uniref:hypothetical protein n=1 Tax=Rhodoblastus sp. TaxID=1962975 RepID=UPI003F9CD39C
MSFDAPKLVVGGHVIIQAEIVKQPGQIVRETKVLSEPETLTAWFGQLGLELHELGWRRVRCRNGSPRPVTERNTTERSVPPTSLDFSFHLDRKTVVELCSAVG